MLTYAWKINTLSKQNNPAAGLDDVIVQTFWECIGSDADNNSSTFYGATSFKLDEVDPENFTPYEELTEAQVLGWVQTAVDNDENYKNHIDEQIQKQINLIVHPISTVIAEELPWAEQPANT
jgi:hypothetical protein